MHAVPTFKLRWHSHPFAVTVYQYLRAHFSSPRYLFDAPVSQILRQCLAIALYYLFRLSEVAARRCSSGERGAQLNATNDTRCWSSSPFKFTKRRTQR